LDVVALDGTTHLEGFYFGMPTSDNLDLISDGLQRAAMNPLNHLLECPRLISVFLILLAFLPLTLDLFVNHKQLAVFLAERLQLKVAERRVLPPSWNCEVSSS
jgi:hypothetical protein